MKIKICIFILLILSFKSSAQIEGKFRHQICKAGPNCFGYRFYKNGFFEFHYSQDVLGRGIIKGKYLKVSDTLKLIPDKVYFSKPTKVLETYNTADSTIRISIIWQRTFKIGEVEEDLKTKWFVSINDNGYVETDENGILIVPKTEIKKIKIKDLFRSNDDSGLVQDSFLLDTDKNNIEIFVSESDVVDKNPMTSWMTRKLLIKGRKLYPITFEAEEAYLGKKKTFYKRID